MSMGDPCLRFDRFTLDLRRAALLDGTEETHLRRKTFDVLAFLVRHAGRVVSKQELSEAVWGDVAVTDDSLVQCLVEIRRALGDQQGVVQTKRGRGYLFDAPVTVVAPAPATTQAGATPVAATPVTGTPVAGAPVAGAPVAARLVVARLSAGVGECGEAGAADDWPAPAPGAWRAPAPAVGRDSRRDSRRVGGTHPVAVIAAILGAAAAGGIAWTALRPPDLREAVPAAASAAAPDRGAPDGATPRTVRAAGGARSVDAQRAYDAGMAGVRTRTRVGLNDAIQQLERAAALAPDDPQIHAGLSDALTLSSVFGLGRPADLLPGAKAAALRAVALDPTLAEAHVSLAHARVQADWDWAGAEASYRRAIALHPNLQRAHGLYGHLLMSVARFDEAQRESARARALATPAWGAAHASSGIIAYIARQPERARQFLRRAIEIDPRPSLAQFWLALTEASRGRLDDAMTAALASRDAAGNAPTPVVGYIHALAGRRSDALEVLRAVEALSTTDYVPATDFALMHVGLGDRDAAIRWLERGVEEHARWMDLSAVHPAWDPLRGDPRFVAIVRRLKLPVTPPIKPTGTPPTTLPMTPPVTATSRVP